MKSIQYILLLFCFLAILYGVGLYVDLSRPITLTETSESPDILLSNSRVYFQEHARNRGIKQLDGAIMAIRKIEQEIDPQSKEQIDLAIEELESVREDMLAEDFDIKKLNDASIRALNALTVAELRLTEHYIETNESVKAKIALKYGQLHVKNALVFAEGSSKKYETAVYEELDSLLETNSLSNEQLLVKIEKTISELSNGD